MAVTRTQIPALTCPSDATGATPANGVTRHNYAANFGNTGLRVRTPLNGAVFGGAPFLLTGGCTSAAQAFKPSDVLDGTSNTLMLAEVVQGHGGDHRGFSWWSDSAGFETQQSPNSAAPDVMNGGTCRDRWTNPSVPINPPCVLAETATAPQRRAARSRHPGGVQASMLDGSVRFVSDNVNINTWRALSTTAGKDPIPDAL
ncbi:MAG: DUF1559 domain-containing protein [Planctomycetes bacterium]|nr:DUF1559 domain-containing protein [Planctomycetota bacterium]